MRLHFIDEHVASGTSAATNSAPAPEQPEVKDQVIAEL
jgi:hypothetical protein